MKKTNDLIKVIIYNLRFNEKSDDSKILTYIYIRTHYTSNTIQCVNHNLSIISYFYKT